MFDLGTLQVKLQAETSEATEKLNSFKSQSQSVKSQVTNELSNIKVNTDVSGATSNLTTLETNASNVKTKISNGKSEVNVDTEKANKNIKTVDKNTKILKTNLSKNLSKIKDSVINVGKKAGTAVVALAGIGMKYNSDMETYTANFTTLMGSNEDAVNKVQELKEMAANTPFGMEDLADATQTLLNFQTPANETNDILQELGDISMGNKDKLKGLSTVFGQVSSAGKLQGQDLMQMINNGFNPLNNILDIANQNTDEFGQKMLDNGVSQKKWNDAIADGQISMGEMKDFMSDGAISADLVKDSMKMATSEGGQFFEGMKNGAQTTAGKLSTLKDDISSKLGELFKSASDKLSDLLPKIDDFIKHINIDDIINQVKDFINVAKVVAPIILGVIGVIKTLTAVQAALNFVMNLNPVTLIITGVIALIAILVVLYNKCKPFRDFVNRCFDGLKKFFGQTLPDFMTKLLNWYNDVLSHVVQWGQDLGTKIGNWFDKIGKFFTETIPNWAKSVGDWFNNIILNIQNWGSNLLNTIGSWFDNVGKFFTVTLPNWAGSVGNWFNNIPSTINNGLGTVWNNISNWFSELFNSVTNWGGNIINSLWSGINSSLDWFYSKVQGIASSIGSFFSDPIGSIKSAFNANGGIMPFANGGLVGDNQISGGIMTQPTVFGYHNGTAYIGGEAGNEAVLPLNKLPELMDKMGYIKPSDVITHISIDGREMAVATTPYLKEELAF